MCLILFQILIEIPYIFVQTTVYALITYSMINFEWTAKKFFWYMYFMYFTFMYFTYYGMMMVALTVNAEVASIVASFFYSFFNLFSGFLIPKPVRKSFSKLLLLKLHFTALWSKCKVAFNKVSGTYWHDWNFGECREFQYGGDGIIGHVLWHGQFMAWSHRNLGMWKLTYKCSVALIRKQWRLLSRATLDSNIHFYQSWLWWCLHFQSCLPLSSSWGSNFWIFNIGKVNHWPLNK